MVFSRQAGSVQRKMNTNREARVEVDGGPAGPLSVARTQPRAWLGAASHSPHGLPPLSWLPSSLYWGLAPPAPRRSCCRYRPQAFSTVQVQKQGRWGHGLPNCT